MRTVKKESNSPDLGHKTEFWSNFRLLCLELGSTGLSACPNCRGDRGPGRRGGRVVTPSRAGGGLATKSTTVVVTVSVGRGDEYGIRGHGQSWP